MSEPRRPHGREEEPAPDEQDLPQQELERRSRDGGDAPAAGTPAEREALARDEDDPWGGEPEVGGEPEDG